MSLGDFRYIRGSRWRPGKPMTWRCPRCEAVHDAEILECPCTTPESLSDTEGRVEMPGDVA